MRMTRTSQLPSTSIYILGGSGHSHLTSKSDSGDLCGSKTASERHPGAALQRRGAPRRRSQRRLRPFPRVLATATHPPASVEREGSELVGQFELCGSVCWGRRVQVGWGLRGGGGSEFSIFGFSCSMVREVEGGSGNHGRTNRTCRSGVFGEFWPIPGASGAPCGVQAGGSRGQRGGGVDQRLGAGLRLQGRNPRTR